MISVNLCVKFGLCNSAIGIFEDIIYWNDKRPLSPPAVMVEVPSYGGCDPSSLKTKSSFNISSRKKNRLQVSFL